MYYYTYVIKSRSDNKLYIGWATDVYKRLEEHNKGLVRATRARVPFELAYFEACRSKTKAIQREKQLKTGYGRAYLKSRI